MKSLAVLALLLCSCSAFAPKTQPVTITATDSTAELFADGAKVGTGSATVELARDRAHNFEARTADGRMGSASVSRQLSSTAMLDIVGGILFLIPLVGLAAPGAWDLSSLSVLIPLPQASTK